MRLRPGDLRSGSWSSLRVKIRSTMAAPPVSCSSSSREKMFNLSYGLFEHSAHDNHTLQINLAPGPNPENLDYFKFVGRSSASPCSIIGSSMHTSRRISIR
ncbi:hypothetical protein BJY52DRAFT_1279828 [Lactarius psammicola]|nr:hypothetical protein BJY52DRAFT_1279828 [Lactarius psammicola]